MISEPELFDGDEPYTDARTIPEQRTEAPVPVEPGASDGDERRRPWLWALGGAIAASAVWAGGLFLHDEPTPVPDTGDWRASRNLCADAKLNALTTELGAPPSAPSPLTRVHPDQHRASCFLAFEGDESKGRFPATVSLTYTLHKKIDPGPEFEAELTPMLSADETPDTLRRVERLGDKAFVTVKGGEELAIHVLDGQAVLGLTVQMDLYAKTGARPPTNLSGIKASMIADTKALMVELQS
ncbi:hypothetical protein ACFQ61_33335 [Streptomyces sp. NPDC056500]|uniref:hypothetical protein n=1 Tax=Streptomyces sp. NPDC056500 TaxID=3345840 RepID=UPI003698EEEB